MPRIPEVYVAIGEFASDDLEYLLPGFEKEFDYKSALQVALENLSETIVAEDREAAFEEPLENMQALVEAEDENKDLCRGLEFTFPPR